MKKGYFLIVFLLSLTFSFGQDKKARENQYDSLVKTQEIKGFEIYPNPVSDGVLRINTFKNTERTIHIFDLLGKQVLYRRTKKNLIDVGVLKSGIYIIRVHEQGYTSTRKLIIK